MFVPEFLFRLSQRDEQVTWLDPFIRQNSGDATATEVTANLAVPNSQILILQSVVGGGNAGAGQNVTRILVAVTPPNTAVGVNLFRLAENAEPSAGAASDRVVNWSGSLIVPPGWSVSVLANFSAALASNNVFLTAIGALIPVGNVQRV